MPETPLTTLDADPGLVEGLRGLWITSAEQLVAAAATPGGERSLAEGLGTTREAVRALVDTARAALTRDKLAELDAGVETNQFGLGARKPPDEPGEAGER